MERAQSRLSTWRIRTALAQSLCLVAATAHPRRTGKKTFCRGQSARPKSRQNHYVVPPPSVRPLGPRTNRSRRAHRSESIRKFHHEDRWPPSALLESPARRASDRILARTKKFRPETLAVLPPKLNCSFRRGH